MVVSLLFYEKMLLLRRQGRKGIGSVAESAMNLEDARRVQARWVEMYQQSKHMTARAAIPFFAVQNRKLVQCGSGLLLRIAHKHFVLTAAHVLDIHAILNLQLYVGSRVQGGPPTPLIGSKLIRSPHNPKLDPVKDYNELRLKESDPLDCGVLELADETAAMLAENRRFATLREVDITGPHKMGCLLLAGFPGSLSKFDEEDRSIISNALWYMTELESPPTDKDGVALHLKYAPTMVSDGGESVAAPPPEGISGCGVWRLAEAKPLKQLVNWKPDDAKLVAIEHAWVKKLRRILATPVVVAIRQIYEQYPELRKIMDLHLGTATDVWR
jgi:hypothetical protein